MQAQGARRADASFVTLDSIAVHGPRGTGVVARPSSRSCRSRRRSAHTSHDIASVLGYGFISRFVVTIDYDHAVLDCTIRDVRVCRSRAAMPWS